MIDLGPIFQVKWPESKETTLLVPEKFGWPWRSLRHLQNLQEMKDGKVARKKLMDQGS